MLNLKRTMIAGVIAVPLALAVPGLAFADTGHTTATQSGSQDQSNSTGQGNSNIAPVTQVNPAINAQDLLGLGATGTDRHSSGNTSHTAGRQSITQDNSVSSTNDQANANSSDQNQSSHQSSHQSSKQDQRRSQTRSTDQSSSQGQSNRARQSNSNIAPVTQVNPAINAQDLLGLGGTSRTAGGQSITQDNSVTSTNDQSNSNNTDQNQSSDQNTRGGLLGIL
ncbi:MAG: hypothetical protein J0I49_08815 [Pseudonocardia sp.]|uniref:hypothetical protein n=1 Tax=Pseudonocardia sp. TaxID=60912 RepID=UPI001ACEEE0C|nr:hypothetical protein [Pseudonocardia sp.]MBN9098196.1 hypothetical protein [Pseudonocardia sp.]